MSESGNGTHKQELYDETEFPTKELCNLSREFNALVKDFITEACKNYKIHEVEGVLISDISVECAKLKIRQRVGIYKKNEN